MDSCAKLLPKDGPFHWVAMEGGETELVKFDLLWLRMSCGNVDVELESRGDVLVLSAAIRSMSLALMVLN